MSVLNTRSVARDSRAGRNPETGTHRAGPALRRRGYRWVKRYVGPPEAETSGDRLRGESSEGRIP
ncbi:MAG: hypothetical protein MI923_18190 [Phycisphaerales bacterium]|nr:hypothetical protein [Phycisphaerales bacterium]